MEKIQLGLTRLTRVRVVYWIVLAGPRAAHYSRFIFACTAPDNAKALLSKIPAISPRRAKRELDRSFQKLGCPEQLVDQLSTGE